MRYRDDDSLTGLDTAQRGGRPRGGRRWTGSLSQRARASRGLPQAVFKISSYSHSAGAVWSRLEYITREGELEAEGPNGERLELDQLESMLEDWEREREEGKGRRVSMSALVSFPPGVDEEKATEAARQFFREAFADNHDYAFAAHRDTDYFHVHVVVQAGGHDGKQLRIGRADIQDLRALFAEQAPAQGIELDASPRWARGLEAQRQKGLGVEGIERRGETPAVGPADPWTPEKELVGRERLSPDRRMQLEALVDVRRQRWARGEKVAADEYVEAAEQLARKIGALDNDQEKVAAVGGAVELAARGLQRAASLQMPGLVASIERVDKAINSQIRGLGSGAAQHAAITARRGLAEKISQYHQGARGREAAAPREAAPAGRACQALEYARHAAGVAGQVRDVPTDKGKVGAVKAAVSLARFGWDLTHTDQGTAEDREEARHIIDRAEVALRFAIKDIEDPQAQRAAEQAGETLYTSEVKEYREQRQQERERDTGPELEP